MFGSKLFSTQRLPSPNLFKLSVPGLRIFGAFASLFYSSPDTGTWLISDYDYIVCSDKSSSGCNVLPEVRHPTFSVFTQPNPHCLFHTLRIIFQTIMFIVQYHYALHWFSATKSWKRLLKIKIQWGCIFTSPEKAENMSRDGFWQVEQHSWLSRVNQLPVLILWISICLKRYLFCVCTFYKTFTEGK